MYLKLDAIARRFDNFCKRNTQKVVKKTKLVVTLQTAKKINKHVYICATIANYCLERYLASPYCVTHVYTTVVHLCSRKEYANRSMVKSS